MTQSTVLWDHTKPESDQYTMPAMFNRMASDNWAFGVMLNNSKIIPVSSMSKVYQLSDGSIWMDVTVMQDADMISCRDRVEKDLFFAPTGREIFSINAAQIACIFELNDG